MERFPESLSQRDDSTPQKRKFVIIGLFLTCNFDPDGFFSFVLAKLGFSFIIFQARLGQYGRDLFIRGWPGSLTSRFLILSCYMLIVCFSINVCF
jgi:hypothetical protein